MSDKKTEFEGKHVFIFTRDGWEFVERKSAKEAVAVVAATDDGKIVLTEQYRRPVDQRVIDLPAGLIGDEDDSDAAATAKKELEEETGYRCRAVERLAAGPSSPGITSEIVHLYRATGLTREGAGGGVDGEEITVHAVPLRDAAEWLRDKEKEGVLIDLKVWSGLYFLSGR
ncbi:MAG: mismatch repair protein MutT [Acidobacteria bacterium]|nr:mismatch repair protein MutT [Acidobacteriota bacterium]